MFTDKVKSQNSNVDCSFSIAFDSFYGANRLETKEVKIDLISFCSTIVNSNMQNASSNYSTARSNFILAWMQVTAKEESFMLLTKMKNHFESRFVFNKEMRKKGTFMY